MSLTIEYAEFISRMVYYFGTVPVSVVGFIANMLLIMTWNQEKYHPTHFILMTLSGVHNGFMCSFHVSYILEHTYSLLWFKITNKILRTMAANTCFFLSVVHYFWMVNLPQSPFFTKTRIVWELVVIGVWSVVLNVVPLTFADTLQGNVSILRVFFHLLAPILPSMAQLFFAGRMLQRVHRRRTKIDTMGAKKCLRSDLRTPETATYGYRVPRPGAPHAADSLSGLPEARDADFGESRLMPELVEKTSPVTAKASESKQRCDSLTPNSRPKATRPRPGCVVRSDSLLTPTTPCAHYPPRSDSAGFFIRRDIVPLSRTGDWKPPHSQHAPPQSHQGPSPRRQSGKSYLFGRPPVTSERRRRSGRSLRSFRSFRSAGSVLSRFHDGEERANEQWLTKAVVVISLVPVLVYPVGVLGIDYCRLRETYHPHFAAYRIVFQSELLLAMVINYTYPFFLLLALLPAFRKPFHGAWYRLLIKCCATVKIEKHTRNKNGSILSSATIAVVHRHSAADVLEESRQESDTQGDNTPSKPTVTDTADTDTAVTDTAGTCTPPTQGEITTSGSSSTSGTLSCDDDDDNFSSSAHSSDVSVDPISASSVVHNNSGKDSRIPASSVVHGTLSTTS